MLEKLQSSLEKPGPYEAPEKSADFDDTKPHSQPVSNARRAGAGNDRHYMWYRFQDMNQPRPAPTGLNLRNARRPGEAEVDVTRLSVPRPPPGS